ncbi:MAG: peptidase C1 [Bacteroidetes bacterium]|nr:MAG: peptidase C1 [Bacteroidota bacterium]
MKHDFVGYRFMKASPNTHFYEASSSLKSSSLPNKVDLRPYLTKVEDQGAVGSCTANAVVGACEYLIKKHGENRFFDVSRLFVYYNARWRGGSQDKDSGSVIQYAVESLQKFGVCSEKTWKYDVAKVLQKPDEKSYQEAAKFKISDFQKVELELDVWKKCLAEGYPIVFGCALFKSFDECSKKGGIVEMPSPDDTTRGSHGAHAMLCVGYSDTDKLFIVRNSWGSDWGDQGYCYMPYNYLMNNKFNFNDCWIVRSTDTMPNPQETWDNKKTTIINDGKGFDWYDPETYNQYTEDDYEDFDVYIILEEYTDGDGEYYEDEPEDYHETFFEFDEDAEIEEGDFEGEDESEEDFDEEEETEEGDFEGEDESEEDFDEEEETEEGDFEGEDESEEDFEEEEETEEGDFEGEDESEEDFDEEEETEEDEPEEEEPEEEEEFDEPEEEEPEEEEFDEPEEESSEEEE